MIVPKWDHCLEYEYQVRRQAIKLIVRKGYSFQSAWWTVYRDVEHRMQHWVQLLTVANSSSDLAHTPSASAAVHNTEVAQLRREVDRLRQSVRVTLAQRWTRTRLHSSLFRTNPLANQETTERRVSAKERSKQTKAKARKEGRKDKKPACSATARSSTGRKFDILGDPASRAFMTANHQNGKVCWHFQRGTCTRDCKRLHECARCTSDTTPANVKRHVSELRVKKFLTLISCMAASLLSLVFPPAKPECSKHSHKVKPSQQTCHILLCSYSAGDGQDVLDVWHSLDWQRFSRCDITHFIFQMIETCSTF